MTAFAHRLSPRVVVIGGGPAAAVATRLLDALEIPALLATPPPIPTDPSAEPHILLPVSALDALAPLGLRERVEAAGTAIASHEIRWPGPDPEDVPGRGAGLVVSEPVLAARLLEGAVGSHVTHVRARGVGIVLDPGGTRVTGVELRPGGLVPADVVLCAVGALLPPACRARDAGPRDEATMGFLGGIDLERVPPGHHYVACEADRWSWALRHPGGAVQLTTFAPPRPERDRATGAGPGDAATAAFPGARVESVAPPRDATPTLPGKGPWPVGLFAIGSALHRLSPASSLGTAQAVRGARAAVAAAHSLLTGSGDPHALGSWHVDTATARAARTHALTVESYRAPAARFETPFWRARTADAWAREIDAAIVRAARAARRYLAASADGSILDAPLVARGPLARTRSLGERGPFVVEQPAVRAPGGRIVPEDLWTHLARVAQALGVEDPFATTEPTRGERAPVRTLRALLEDGDDRLAADPKRTRRSLGALVEAGVIAFADEGGD